MQPKPKPRTPRQIELYLLAEESTTKYLHDVEQSLNIKNIDRPATVKFTDDVELALKFPSKTIACTFQDWIQDYFGTTTNIILLPTRQPKVLSIN